MADERERKKPIPSASPMARMLQPPWQGRYTKPDMIALPDSLKRKPSRRSRSLYLRHVDCGSCGACEVELSALDNPVYDIRRLGMEFRSTPRQAHLLVLTGPYTQYMDLAAWQALQVMAQRFSRETTGNETNHLGCVILLGDCAINGGVFEHAHGLAKRAQAIERQIVARIYGCPPTPAQILGSLEVLAQYLEIQERSGNLPDDISKYVIHDANTMLQASANNVPPLVIYDPLPE